MDNRELLHNPLCLQIVFWHLLYFKIKTKKSLYGRNFDVANTNFVFAVEYLLHI